MRPLWYVAIPSTSGQSFTRKIENIRNDILFESQSLLHQVNHSHSKVQSYRNDIRAESQSLLHQVNHSHRSYMVFSGKHIKVAIPSTSGQSFTQKIKVNTYLQYSCRNPFYIRSIIHTSVSNPPLNSNRFVAIPSTSGQSFTRE